MTVIVNGPLHPELLANRQLGLLKMLFTFDVDTLQNFYAVLLSPIGII